MSQKKKRKKYEEMSQGELRHRLMLTEEILVELGGFYYMAALMNKVTAQMPVPAHILERAYNYMDENPDAAPKATISTGEEDFYTGQFQDKQGNEYLFILEKKIVAGQLRSPRPASKKLPDEVQFWLKGCFISCGLNVPTFIDFYQDKKVGTGEPLDESVKSVPVELIDASNISVIPPMPPPPPESIFTPEENEDEASQYKYLPPGIDESGPSGGS